MDIINLLITSELAPRLFPALVAQDIVFLDKEEEDNIKAADPKQDLVPALVWMDKLLVAGSCQIWDFDALESLTYIRVCHLRDRCWSRQHCLPGRTWRERERERCQPKGV